MNSCLMFLELVQLPIHVVNFSLFFTSLELGFSYRGSCGLRTLPRRVSTQFCKSFLLLNCLQVVWGCFDLLEQRDAELNIFTASFNAIFLDISGRVTVTCGRLTSIVYVPFPILSRGFLLSFTERRYFICLAN